MRAAARISLGLILCCGIGCWAAEQRRQTAHRAAEEALEAGAPMTAEKILRGALAYDPRDLAARTRLAQLLATRGASREARRVLAELPGDVASDIAFRRLLAQMLVETGDLERAAALLASQERRGEAEPQTVRRLLETLADQGRATGAALPLAWQRRLAELLAHRDALEAASCVLAKLPADDPERGRLATLLVRRGLRRGDLGLLRAVVEENDPPDTPWRLLAEHRLLLTSGRAGEAAALESSFLQRFPSHPASYDLLLTKARREVRRGSHRAGLELARMAVALDPGRPEALVEQGLAFLALDRPDDARRSFQLALAADPHDAVATRMLAQLSWSATRARLLALRLEASAAAE